MLFIALSLHLHTNIENMLFEINENVYNPAYKPFFNTRKRFVNLMGGAGSGKSTVQKQDVVGNKFLATKSYRQWYEARLCKYSKRDLELYCKVNKLPTYSEIDYVDKNPNLPRIRAVLDRLNIRFWNEKIVLARSQQNLVRYSQFAEIKTYIRDNNLSQFVKINESNLTMQALGRYITGRNGRREWVLEPNGNEIMCAGLRSGGADRLKSVVGITRFWIEEATDGGISKEDIEQLNLRLRVNGCNDMQIVMTYNPVHAEHWLNQHFWLLKKVGTNDKLSEDVAKELEENTFKLKTTYKDNRFLPYSYLRNIELLKETNPKMYNIYALGEWGGSSEGCVIKKWTKVNEFPDEVDNCVYGIDFGQSHAYTIVKVGFLEKDIVKGTYIDNNGIITKEVLKKGIYVQEIAYEREMITQDLIDKYRHLLPENAKYYIDHAAKEAKTVWRNNGYDVINSNKRVEGGIAFLQSNMIHVVCGKDFPSINYINELMNYKYQSNKITGGFKDVVVKEYDDLIDATRYAAYTEWGQKGTFDMKEFLGLKGD